MDQPTIQLREQLDLLSEMILRLGGLTEDAIGKSVRALVDRDSALAEEVRNNDHLVDELELEIDHLCMEILARHQPMARDLRFVATAMKITPDLERIADHSVNISERAIDLAGRPLFHPTDEITTIADLARGMLHDAVEALIEKDADKAMSVIDRDDLVDRHYLTVFQQLLQGMKQDSSGVHRGLQLQSVAKWLERMADHITNLAEQVIFMVRGQDIRHAGKLDVRSG